ncbi:MAG: transposase, partial [Polyangiaceae bacterium]|nr:transposase [Polyangiaceae bacterium]
LRYGASTIERWYYAAKNETKDPIEALARKVPSHAGKQPSMSPELAKALELQYRQHPSWTYELHRENLLALAKERPELGGVPSSTTVARYMKNGGLVKRRKRKKRADEESSTFEPRERRSFEVSHVHALWHSDYYVGSRRVIDADGVWHKAYLLAFLDDYSRLVCHAQWYLEESIETFVHGLSQAIQKRGLPRALLTDNGSPMMGAEAQEGLARLSIVHHTTLPYTPASGHRSPPRRRRRRRRRSNRHSAAAAPGPGGRPSRVRGRPAFPFERLRGKNKFESGAAAGRRAEPGCDVADRGNRAGGLAR